MRHVLAVCLVLFLPSIAAFAEEVTGSYDKSAIGLMTKSEYPDWNETWIARANREIYSAAKKASQSPECDKLTYISIIDHVSEPTSIPNKKIVFFATCANEKRFNILESDLKSEAPQISIITKTHSVTDSVTNSQALFSCMKSVQSTLHHPSTFNMHMFSTSVYRAPSTGNIATTFDFDAKNSFGLELKYHARCVIDGTGQSAPEISESQD